MQKICFFIGHHDTPDSVRGSLTEAVERYIAEYGISVFVVGKYGGFDRLAAEAVVQAKKKYADVSLLQLRPYSITEGTVTVPKGYNGIFRPSGMEEGSSASAIIRANRYMIEHSDCLIACVWRPEGNSGRILEYALDREKRGLIRVENLAEMQNNG